MIIFHVFCNYNILQRSFVYDLQSSVIGLLLSDKGRTRFYEFTFDVVNPYIQSVIFLLLLHILYMRGSVQWFVATATSTIFLLTRVTGAVPGQDLVCYGKRVVRGEGVERAAAQ